MHATAIRIEYKAKIKEMADGRKYINYKKKLNRIDCLLKPHEHSYYNCEMFPSILNRSALKAQNNRTWCYIDELPEGITINRSGFLAVVSITC